MNDAAFDSKMNDDNFCMTEITQLEGYLLKKSKHLKSLRKRWIILNKNLFIFIYKKRRCTEKKYPKCV